MSIYDLHQPDIILINDTIRISKAIKNQWSLALKWYQNPLIMYYSEGNKDISYNMEDINRMYTYLSGVGELYFIEIYDGDSWRAIGDVTLSEQNLPLIIGEEEYWGKGIGKEVIQKLIERAREIGLKSITVPEIYHYNERSIKLFMSLGFIEISNDENGKSYRLIL
jgi:RimJ/RimL family protein N-acetyltransferase